MKLKMHRRPQLLCRLRWSQRSCSGATADRCGDRRPLRCPTRGRRVNRHPWHRRRRPFASVQRTRGRGGLSIDVQRFERPERTPAPREPEAARCPAERPIAALRATPPATGVEADRAARDRHPDAPRQRRRDVDRTDRRRHGAAGTKEENRAMRGRALASSPRQACWPSPWRGPLPHRRRRIPRRREHPAG